MPAAHRWVPPDFRAGREDFGAATAWTLRFMTIEGRVNAEVFREFLRCLITGLERKSFPVVDGHPAHRSKLVKRFAEDNAERLELFQLPPRSLDIDSDELARGHVKARAAEAAAQTKDELRRMADRALHRLQKLPNVVAGFFQAPTCRHAAMRGFADDNSSQSIPVVVRRADSGSTAAR